MKDYVKSRYFCDSEKEGYRLELKTSRDEALLHLSFSGIQKGGRFLDLGCGTGAVSRAMMEEYDPELICGLDISRERLKFGRTIAREKKMESLNFINGDCFHLPFRKDAFDFVWSRFLFQLIPRVDVVLEEVKRVTRNGGRVTFAELDGNGFFHYPLDRETEELSEKVLEALQGVGFDHLMGRKLFHLFKRAGLKDVTVNIVPYQVVAGTADDIIVENWKMKMDIVTPILEEILRDRHTIELFRERVISYLKAEDTLSYNVLFITSGEVHK